MLALLFPCHGKWNLQIHCPISNPLVEFILNRQLLVSRSLMKLFSMIKMLTSVPYGVPSGRSELFILPVQQIHVDNVPVAYLFPWLLSCLMTPFLHKCLVALFSLTLGCSSKSKKKTLLPKNLFMKTIYLNGHSISWTLN